jgi:hypothetical protein
MSQMGLGRFRPENEKKFISERENTLSRVSSQYVADNPHLYSSRIIWQNTIFRYELFKMIRNVPGAIVECGVARGNSLMQFANMSSIMEPYNFTRSIIGFDTFEGFRSLTEAEKKSGLTEKDFADSNEHLLRESIELFDIDRPMNHMQKVELVKGDATVTIGEYVATHPELSIALLYLDFDVYEPTLSALNNLSKLVCKGGIIALDEYGYKHFSGETQAVKDYFGNLNKVELKRLDFDPLRVYLVV